MPGVPLVMTHGKDPYPLRLANKATPRVHARIEGERERESVDEGKGGAGGSSAISRRKKNNTHKKKTLQKQNWRGRNSKWVTVSQDSRKKKGSREQQERRRERKN